MQHVTTLALLAAVAQSSPVFASTWGGPLSGIPRSGHELSLHPFQLQGTGLTGGLKAFGDGRATLADAMRELLADQVRSPLVEMRAERSGERSLDYRFFVRGVPLCGFQVRAHALGGRAALVLGSVPDVDPGEPVPVAPGEWPEQALAAEKAADAVRLVTQARRVIVQPGTRCFHVAPGGRLLPVWNLTVTADGLPYEALADGYEVVGMQRAYFDVDGQGLVYPRNAAAGAATMVTLPGLAGDGTLRTPEIRTVVPTGYLQANKKDETFVYPTTDARFSEVQAFAHAQQHLAWLEGQGFANYGPLPIDVDLHVAPLGHRNNALYTPGNAQTGARPRIEIDDGDGEQLQNLTTDADVVSHELGHHVLFRTLKTTYGESLVLHEGLADSFVFLHKDDPCLGESICPAGSQQCLVPNQCLRSAIFPVAYDDAHWRDWAGTDGELGHRHGQVVSGFIWDLKLAGVPLADVTAMTMKAVTFFKEDSGLRDLLLAVMTADRELFACRYDGEIRQAIVKRNLSGFVADVPAGCDGLPNTGGGGEAGLTAPGAQTPDGGAKKLGKADPFTCGVMAGAADGGRRAAVMMMVLLAVPVVVGARPKAVRVRLARRRLP